MRISSAAFALGAIKSAQVHANPIGQTDGQILSRAGPPQTITGLYGTNSAPAAVVISDVNGRESWKWTANDARKTGGIPGPLLDCITRNLAVPEVKWADGGRAVLTVFNGAALLISHLPGNPQDKKIKFGTCVNRGTLGNTHSLELVPDNKIAIATAYHGYTENIQLFDIGRGLQPNAAPVEKLDTLPAVHGLVWDQKASMLWAVGNDHDPEGKTPSAAFLYGYAYKGGRFGGRPARRHQITGPTKLATEWAGTKYDGWWDGGHDVIGLPNQRKLLMSVDTDLFAFDIASSKFESGDAVVKKYLPGFQPVDKRVGANGKSLPRSDIKGFSIDGDKNALYVQATWKDVTSHQVNRLANGKLQPARRFSQEVYKSRWFQDTPGWPKANSR